MYDVSDIVNLQNAINPTQDDNYTSKLCNLIHIPSPETWYLTAQQLIALIEKKIYIQGVPGGTCQTAGECL